MSNNVPSCRADFPSAQGSPHAELFFKMLRVTHALIRETMPLLQAHGVTPPQFGVMLYLHEQEEAQQYQVADELMVTKGNVSQILKVMEREGLVVRKAEGTAKTIHLTEKAHTILEAVVPQHHALLAEQMAVWSLEDVMTMSALVDRLYQSLE